MTNTGKKLTPQQLQAIRNLINQPVMYLSGGKRMGGDESPQQMVHRYALEAGLPEIPGYYGADLRDGTIYKV